VVLEFVEVFLDFVLVFSLQPVLVLGLVSGLVLELELELVHFLELEQVLEALDELSLVVGVVGVGVDDG
jgi:hypothetical protein